MQKCRPRDHLRTVAAEGKEARTRCTEKKRVRRTVVGEEALDGVASTVAEERSRRSALEKEAVGELLGLVAVAVGALLGCGGGGGAPGLQTTAGRSGARRRKLGQRRFEEEDCSLK